MKMNEYHFDWSDLAFGSKKPLKELKAVFIPAPRELSTERFKQLVMKYLPQGNILLGLSKESYVEGYEDQPQFKMLSSDTIESLVNQINTKSNSHGIRTISYFQRELPYILEKIPFKRVVLVNGSWKHVFHASPSFFILSKSNTPYEMVSPFASEKEAMQYAAEFNEKTAGILDSETNFEAEYTAEELLDIANKSARRSFDYGFQTGVSVGKSVKGKPGKYKLLKFAYNKVVPYQTYALHYGALREKHLSPPNDLNHYDTIHAEVSLLLEVQKAKIDLHGTSVFINLMPCPPCARMFSQTDISEFVYTLDHSDGYAVQLLEKSGKKVRRLIPKVEAT